jgi:succinate dehydrogenase / fumarate reductase, cytochrome b subunit
MSEAKMALKRNVGLKGFRYRGGGPMWAWILHRVSGLAMILFVGMHIIASFSMQQFGSDIATSINIVYESVYFQVFILFVVLYHGLNGLRIIILDTWPQLLEYQREVTWLQWLVFIPVYGLTVAIMVLRTLSGS